MKRENKFFIFCLVMIIILGSFRAWTRYEHDKQEEETNRIVKELRRKTAELENTYMAPYNFEPPVTVEDNDTPVVGSPIGETKSVPSQNGFFS